MSATLKVDQEDFQRTLLRAAANTSRSLPVFLNSRMFHIMKTARDETPIASRAKIESDLGATLVSHKVDKRGRNRRKYSYAPTQVVYAIVNARRRRAGLPPVQRSEMAGAAKKLIAGRLRAVGSLRSGFTRGMAILASKIFASIDRSGPPVRQASFARPAQDGWNPKVEFEYRETVQAGAGVKQIDPRVVAAVEGGFQREQSEMLQHLEKTVADSLRKAGAL